MYRNILLAGALALTATTVAGCHLYMEDDYDDGYSYCDDTGCYWCDDWGCYPEGSGGGEGWECVSNYDCAAGCYCGDYGYCEESPFCSTSEECGEGWVCDDRSTCVPEGSEDGECTTDADCPLGTFCDEASGYCIGSWTCYGDDECGMGYECDEERGTCIPTPCTDDSQCLEGCYCDEDSGQCIEGGACDEMGNCPEGMECDPERNSCVPDLPDPVTCQGDVTCEELPPTCADGTNPGIVNGCYNGECVADAECPDGAPVYCEDHDNEADCSADDRCENVYRGINCQDPNGGSCTADEAMCECESFKWHECLTAE